MTQYPKQETGTVRGTVCCRDAVTIRRDTAPGGAGQPSYTGLVAEQLLAEVLQVAGGESVRGRIVEADTAYVVTCEPVDGVTPRCQVEILSGPYAGARIYVGRVLHETARGRPMRMQLHCRLSEQPAS